MQTNGEFFFDNNQYDGIELDLDDHLKDLVAEFEQVKSEHQSSQLVVQSPNQNTQVGRSDVNTV